MAGTRYIVCIIHRDQVNEEPEEEEQPRERLDYNQKHINKINSKLRTSIQNMRSIITDVKQENGKVISHKLIE
jgi:hypothetical protein